MVALSKAIFELMQRNDRSGLNSGGKKEGNEKRERGGVLHYPHREKKFDYPTPPGRRAYPLRTRPAKREVKKRTLFLRKGDFFPMGFFREKRKPADKRGENTTIGQKEKRRPTSPASGKEPLTST